MLQGKYYFYKGNKESDNAYQAITSFYAHKRTHTITDANYIFPYGGDGSMLGTLKTLLETMRQQDPKDRWPTQVLGIHYGGKNSKGYLMNPPLDDSFDLSSMVHFLSIRGKNNRCQWSSFQPVGSERHCSGKTQSDKSSQSVGCQCIRFERK